MSFRYSSPANPISNSIQLRNPRDPHIDMRNLVPGSKIDHARLRKSKHRLKRPYGRLRSGSVDPVRRNPRDRCIHSRHRVKLLLQLPHLITGGTNLQIISPLAPTLSGSPG